MNILNVLLILALVTAIAGTVAVRQPTGPEGPVGVWIVLLIPCLFLTVLAFILVAKGFFKFIPGGGLIQFATAVGALITFSIFLFGMLSHEDSVIQYFWIAVPYLILAGFAAVIFQSSFPDPKIGHWIVAILLGVAALAGWCLAGVGIFQHLKNEMERTNQQMQEAQEQANEHEQRQIDEYAQLGDAPPLGALLRFTWSRNDEIEKKAQKQVNEFPDLDDRLIELLDQDRDSAITYIAKIHENPPAKLAPAWGRMLERKLKKWDILQHWDNAGTYEYNIRDYFEGARRIQLAGGPLGPQLKAWHDHLQKCKGLGSVQASVKKLIESDPQSQ